MTGVLEARGLVLEAGGRTLLQDLDLRLAPGQCWAMLGRNGAGKTTLLHALAGLRPPARGEVFWDGRPLDHWPRRTLARRLGLMPQDSGDPFPATVLETALLGRHPHIPLLGAPGPEDRRRAREALAAVDLAHLEDRATDSLSGGERRRLAAAAVLCQDPRVFLLDEPLNHLDIAHQVALLRRFRELARERCVCMSLHEPNLARRWCTHALLLLPGGAHRHGPVDEILDAAALEAVYGHPFLGLQAPWGPVFLPR